jgi:hypothetical protein
VNFAIKANVVTNFLDANSVAYTSGSLGTTALQPASADPELVVSLRRRMRHTRKRTAAVTRRRVPARLARIENRITLRLRYRDNARLRFLRLLQDQ